MCKQSLDHFYTTGDAHYRYRIEGSGEALVLLHGFTGTLHTWDAVADRLRDHFTIIRVDLPGHGKTECPSGRSMEQFSADLDGLLASLHIASCVLVGYSLGGRTALSFAQYYPERVKSLVLESASPGLEAEADRQARIENDRNLANKILQEGIVSFVDAWENIPLFASQKTLPKELQEAIRAERLSQDAEGLAMSLRTMGTGAQSSWWGVLDSMEMPVTLIVGELDEKFVGINQEMNKGLRQSTLFTVENAGHCVHVEQVEKFVKIVMEQEIK